MRNLGAQADRSAELTGKFRELLERIDAEQKKNRPAPKPKDEPEQWPPRRKPPLEIT